MSANRKGIDWDKQPLGEVTDSALARTLGVAQPTVTRARAARGIVAFADKGKIDWNDQPFGKLQDKDLARILGVRATTVTRQRNDRGVRAYRCRTARPNKKLARAIIAATPAGASLPAMHLALMLLLGDGSLTIGEIRDGLRLPQATTSDLCAAAQKAGRVAILRAHGHKGLTTLVRLAPRALQELRKRREVDAARDSD
jgi:DNA-binding MarR family transcriptional regulator